MARPAGIAAVMGACVLLAACGGGGGGTPGASGASQPASSSGSDAAATLTVQVGTVAGLGDVLVNGSGQTFYILTSEKGGKLTCTADNGCTRVWPDTQLPAGITQGIAGSGAQASLLGTLKSADGHLYLTYGGWPLYTYSGDSGPMEANGQGVMSFGGTWWALSPSGTPVTTKLTPNPTASNGGY